jgi:RNA polymerase sigma-70 factor (ECF subfamily)
MGHLPKVWLRLQPMADKEPHNLAEEAFRRHSAQVYRYLLRRTGDESEAEELTQRVFADAAAALSSSDPPDSLLAWLYAVAERRFVDELRRRSRLRDALRQTLEADRAPPQYGASAARALGAAIGDLPEAARQVVVMKLLEGRSFAEIASKVGVSEAACKMRFSRGLAQLRDDLKEQGWSP